MDLLGNAFNYLRDKYIIPLVQYGIRRNNVKYWGLKTIFTNNIISLNPISKNTIELEISEEDFYKSSLCDIELFNNKTVIQYNEYFSSKKKNSTWSFVSLYYYFFFSATTLMRMMQRGFIYLDALHTRALEDYSLAMDSTPIKLEPGNYFYSVKGFSSAGNIIIVISNKGEGIHQLTWIQLECILRQEIMPNASADESFVYSYLLSFINHFDSRFPSVLRNKLNYPSESSLLDLEKTLPEIRLDLLCNDFPKSFSKIKLDDSLLNQLMITAHYSLIIFNLVQSLYKEFERRSKYHKDFQKERIEYIIENKITLLELQ